MGRKKYQIIYDDKLYFESHKGQNGRVTAKEGWPFDKPYFLILNVAVGGNWGGAIDESIFPNEMVVDLINTSAFEPGNSMNMLTLGGAISGNWATGLAFIAIKPRKTIPRDNTIASTGL